MYFCLDGSDGSVRLAAAISLPVKTVTQSTPLSPSTTVATTFSNSPMTGIHALAAAASATQKLRMSNTQPVRIVTNPRAATSPIRLNVQPRESTPTSVPGK